VRRQRRRARSRQDPRSRCRHGLSFDDYDASTEVTGIDLCAPMLAKARQKMASGRYPHVKDVQLMDAHRMAFADATFDCVVAQFVITLVADPEQVLSECHRVVKPGGRSSSVNHLYSEVGIAAAVERWAARRTRALGLRPEFPFARLQAWAQSNKDANLVEQRKVAPFGCIRWSVSSDCRRRRDVNSHHPVMGFC